MRRRGLVTGLLTASFATGNLVFLPLLAWITDEHGWRWAAAIVAITAVATIPLVLLLMRERPSDVGLAPYGSADGAPVAPVVYSGRTLTAPLSVLRTAVRVRDFWLLAGTFFVCGWTTNGAVQYISFPPRTITASLR